MNAAPDVTPRHAFGLPSCAAGPDWRATSVGALLPTALAHAQSLGIEAPTDLTEVDTLGVPVWKTTRPDAVAAAGNVSMLNGKAWSSDGAKLGALMEAIERHYGERPEPPIMLARPSELRARGSAFVHPTEVPLAHGIADPGDARIAWFEAIDASGAPCWIPAHDVQCPYRPIEGAANPIAWRSTGLSAGANETEATLYGLLEVIERDAWAVARLSRRGHPVDLTTSGSTRLRRLAQTLEQHSITLQAHELSSIGGLHTYAAALGDASRGGDLFPDYGLCAHSDPYIALEHAVIEATQSRLVVMTEAREDSARLDHEMQRAQASGRTADEAWLRSTGAPRPAPAAPMDPPDDIARTLDGIVTTLHSEGFERVAKIRLNPANDPVAVVRVIVPGASEAMHRAFWLGRRIRVRQ